MKRLLLIILAVLTMISLVACGKKEETPNSDETTPPVEENTTPQEEVKMSNEEMYGSIIADYEKAIADYDLDNIEADTTIPTNLSETLIMHIARYQDTGVSLSYAYYDIDRNGTDELLVGANNGLGAIYAYDEDSKVPVPIAFQSTMERGNMAIYENGIILMEGAGGAALHYYEFGNIGSDGKSYQTLESIQEEYTEGSETPVYTNVDTGEKLEYTSLEEIMNKFIDDSSIVPFGETII